MIRFKRVRHRCRRNRPPTRRTYKSTRILIRSTNAVKQRSMCSLNFATFLVLFVSNLKFPTWIVFSWFQQLFLVKMMPERLRPSRRETPRSDKLYHMECRKEISATTEIFAAQRYLILPDDLVGDSCNAFNINKHCENLRFTNSSDWRISGKGVDWWAE